MSIQVPKCVRCATTHALYVKAHRQLQQAGRRIIMLEAKVRELESQLPLQPRRSENDDVG